jgi:hypothetical protein
MKIMVDYKDSGQVFGLLKIDSEFTCTLIYKKTFRNLKLSEGLFFNSYKLF